MNKKTLADYTKEAGENAVEKGFSGESVPTMLIGIMSEIVEALEADSNIDNRSISSKDTLQELIPLFSSKSEDQKQRAISVFNNNEKDCFEDEIADTFIRLFTLCDELDIDIEQHIQVKMAYNKTREYKHGK